MQNLDKEELFGTMQFNLKELASGSKDLQVKQTRSQLKQYSRQLEEAVANMKQKYLELEKDHDSLNKTYLNELKKSEKLHKLLPKIKKHINSMVGSGNDTKLCNQCGELQEIEELKKLVKDH